MKSESLKELGSKILPQCLATLLITIFWQFAPRSWADDCAAVLRNLSSKALVSTVAIPAIVCVLEFVWIDSLVGKKWLIKRYNRLREFQGIYQHKQSGEKVCGTCLLGDGKEHPVAEDGDALICSKCDGHFSKSPNPEDQGGVGYGGRYPRGVP